MGKFKSKADTSFEIKLEKAIEDRDFYRVNVLFSQYGSYLELIDGSIEMDNKQVMVRYNRVDDLLKGSALT